MCSTLVLREFQNSIIKFSFSPWYLWIFSRAGSPDYTSVAFAFASHCFWRYDRLWDWRIRWIGQMLVYICARRYTLDSIAIWWLAILQQRRGARVKGYAILSATRTSSLPLYLQILGIRPQLNTQPSHPSHLSLSLPYQAYIAYLCTSEWTIKSSRPCNFLWKSGDTICV